MTVWLVTSTVTSDGCDMTTLYGVYDSEPGAVARMDEARGETFERANGASWWNEIRWEIKPFTLNEALSEEVWGGGCS